MMQFTKYVIVLSLTFSVTGKNAYAQNGGLNSLHFKPYSENAENVRTCISNNSDVAALMSYIQENATSATNQITRKGKVVFAKAGEAYLSCAKSANEVFRAQYGDNKRLSYDASDYDRQMFAMTISEATRTSKCLKAFAMGKISYGELNQKVGLNQAITQKVELALLADSAILDTTNKMLPLIDDAESANLKALSYNPSQIDADHKAEALAEEVDSLKSEISNQKREIDELNSAKWAR